MINRRSFFRSVGTLGTVVGFLGFEKFLKTEEVKQLEKKPLPKYGFKITGKYSSRTLTYSLLYACENDKLCHLYNLLEKPNLSQTFSDLVESCIVQLDWTGTSLIWMIPNKLGIPMELHPIPTAIAIPQPAINPDYPDGYYRIQPLYPYDPFTLHYTPAIYVGAPIPAQWMLRIKYSHPLLRYDGYSPQTAMRLHLDELDQIKRSCAYTGNTYSTTEKKFYNRYVVQPKLQLISCKLTRYLAPFFGKNIKIEVFENKE